MSDVAIQVEGLSKRYRIGRRERYHTLRESLSNLVTAPFRRLSASPAPDSPVPRFSGSQENDTIWALKDVSFSVPHGEVVGIIGRNGAGKSTLLKILSRITTPTEGRAVVNGRVGSLLEVGTGFHPELTGRENIYLNGAILGMKRAEIDRKFDEIVAFAEVEKFIDTPVKHYSSGMYVRLAFAVAAHLEPEILLVDEVLAVGDAAFQKKCLGKMEDVAKAGRTVLFVSHQMSTILDLCPRCILLSDGRLSLDGATAKIVGEHLSGLQGQDEEPELVHSRRIQDFPRRASLISAKLISPLKTGPWILPFGSDIELKIGIRVDKLLDAVELGLGLFTALGYELSSNLSSHHLDPECAFQPGTYYFVVRYPGLVLLPGLYRFGVGVRSERGMEDYIYDGFRVTIAESENVKGRKVGTLKGAIVAAAEFFLLQDSGTTARPDSH